MCKLERLERGGVEHDLARVANARAVGEDPLEGSPARVGPEFLEDFAPLGRDMGIEGLAGIVGGE